MLNAEVKYPPWKLLPELDPNDPDSHGVAEAYILIDWLRFWQLLRPEEQETYLDAWNATPAWRQAIRDRYDHQPVEIDREAIQAVREMRGEEAANKRPWWHRLWPFRDAENLH